MLWFDVNNWERLFAFLSKKDKELVRDSLVVTDIALGIKINEVKLPEKLKQKVLKFRTS